MEIKELVTHISDKLIEKYKWLTRQSEAFKINFEKDRKVYTQRIPVAKAEKYYIVFIEDIPRFVPKYKVSIGQPTTYDPNLRDPALTKYDNHYFHIVKGDNTIIFNLKHNVEFDGKINLSLCNDDDEACHELFELLNRTIKDFRIETTILNRIDNIVSTITPQETQIVYGDSLQNTIISVIIPDIPGQKTIISLKICIYFSK